MLGEGLLVSAVLSLDVQVGRGVYFVGNVFSVLFHLAHTFGQKVFYLPVDGAEIVLRPSGDGVVQPGGEAKGDLLFLIFGHLNISFRN